MTPEERAEQVIRDVHKELPDSWLGGRQRYVLVDAIAAALREAEQRAFQEAAKVAENGRFLHEDAPDARFGKACAAAIRQHAAGTGRK